MLVFCGIIIVGKTASNVISARRLHSISQEMVYIAGGTQTYAYQVTVSSFYLSKFELTEAQYNAMMEPASSQRHFGSRRPVTMISWCDAIEFCNLLSRREGLEPCYSYADYGTNPDKWPFRWKSWQKDKPTSGYSNHQKISCNWEANGYRLPTEDEWKFAARGGMKSNDYDYSGSNNYNDVAWCFANSAQGAKKCHAQKVGTKAPNELGIYDMSGNAYEMTWNIHQDEIIHDPSNHTPTSDRPFRAIRGGSFQSSPRDCAVWERSYAPTTVVSETIGFRLCRGGQ